MTASASITLYQTAPRHGTVRATLSLHDALPIWSGFADSGSGLNAGSYKLVFSTAGTPAAACTSGTVLSNGAATSFTHTGLTEIGRAHDRTPVTATARMPATAGKNKYTAPTVDGT